MIVNENTTLEQMLDAATSGEPLETTIEESVVEIKTESIMDILTEANEEDWGIALGDEPKTISTMVDGDEPTEAPSANAPVSCEEEITFKANEKINHSDDELQALADSLDNGTYYTNPFARETKTIEEPKQKEVVNTSKISSVKLNKFLTQIKFYKASKNIEAIKKLLLDAEWDYGREGRAELERILKENREAKFVKEIKAMEVKEKPDSKYNFKFISPEIKKEELPSLDEIAAMC